MASCFSVMKKYMSTTNVMGAFKHVTIVGGGLMGSGIAQVTAQSGIDVTIVELNEEAMKKSDTNIKNSIQRVAKKLFQNRPEDAEKYISESMGRLKISLELNEVVAKTDLVVEAIVENMAAKHKLFSKIDTIAPEHTIFASNTSSLPIKEIASVTNRRDRFGGLHFFNPVPVMKLLEVIRTDETSEDTFQKMLAWGKAIGKTTISCKDTPGFVVNRLLIPYLAEAARMLERGDASAKDIDIAMKLGAGYPMGPLELLDYVGLDTTKFILDGWHKKDPNNLLFKPISLLDKLVSEGKLGKKTGEGFYSYKKNYKVPSYALYSPYFEPLPPPPTPDSSQKALAPHIMSKFEKFNRKRTEYSGSENSVEYNNLIKMQRAEKLKRLDKLKLSVKSAEDSTKAEKETKEKEKKQASRRLRSFGSFRTNDVFRSQEKARNLEDFIRFERNKGLLLERN